MYLSLTCRLMQQLHLGSLISSLWDVSKPKPYTCSDDVELNTAGKM